MKKITTDNITTSVGMPIKSGTLQHLQSAYQEALDALARTALGAVDPSKIYVLWGCENTGTYPNFIISEGAVYYNGEIYLVPAANITVPYGDAQAVLDVSYFSAGNADPVQFTDGISYNVHEIRQIIFTVPPTVGISDFAYLIRNYWTIVESPDVTIDTGSATISVIFLKYKRVGDVAYVNLNMAGSVTPSLGRFYLTVTLPDIIAAVFASEFEQPNAAAAFEVANNLFQAYAYIQYGGENQLKIKAESNISGLFNIGVQLTYQVAP